MALSEEELKQRMTSAFPSSFRRRAVAGLFAAYASADNLAHSSFTLSEAENVLGNLVRADTEENIRGAAELSRLDVQISRVDRTAWNYTQVHAADAVLVAKAVAYPGGPIDSALHRQALSQDSQMVLNFDDTGVEEERPEANKLFVVLLHSRYVGRPQVKRTPENRRLCGSAHLVCPHPKTKAYLCEIDLFAEFPDVVSRNVPAAWDQPAVLRFIEGARSAPYRTRRAA